MSSTYSKNKKELSGVKVVSASDVWQKRNGKFRLRKDIDIVGKVELPLSNFILKANNEERQTGYIEDVSALPVRAKNEIVCHFYNKQGKRTRNTVAYLVRTDKKSKVGKSRG